MIYNPEIFPVKEHTIHPGLRCLVTSTNTRRQATATAKGTNFTTLYEQLTCGWLQWAGTFSAETANHRR